MTQSCFLCSDEAVAAEDEISIPCHNANLNLFLLNQILGMTDFSNSQIKLVDEIKLCHPCIVRILNIQNMLHQLEKLEKKVSYEKYLIEVQLKEGFERRDFHRQRQDHNKKSNDHGRIPLIQLRDEIVTALKSETIETMLTKLQKGTIGQVKSGRIRIMKEVSLSKLDATTVTAAMNTAEGQEWNTRRMPIECKLEDIDMNDEPDSYGSFQNLIPITSLDPFGMELEPSTNMNMRPELESEAGLNLVEGSDEISITTKKFICGVCEARFDHYIDLANHDKVHLSIPSNSRPGNSSQVKVKSYGRQTKLKCHICSKVVNKKSLKGHMDIHKEITYPRKCSKCEVFCPNYNDWLDHKRLMHPGEFKCTICQLSFGRSYNLKRHLLCHANKITVHCKFCSSSFRSLGSYRSHLKIFHSKN